MGFVTPQELWLKEIENEVREILITSFSNRWYIKTEQIQTIVDDYYKGNNSLGKLVWKMLCLELWLMVYFDKK
jgi:hypothetical protein